MAQTNVQAFSGDVEVASNLAVNTDTLFVDTESGKVGIGVTTPEYNLQVRGSGGVRIGVESTGGFGGLEIGGASGGLIDFKTPFSDDSDARILYSGGSLKFSGTDVAFNTDTLFVDIGAGSIGIGTVSPDNVLHIRNAVPAVLLDDSDDNTKVRFAGGSGGDLYVDSNWGGSGSTGDIIFREASSEKMRITGSGNVGIGKNDPGTALDVNGTVTATAFSGTATNADNVQVDRFDTGDSACFLTFTNNNTANKKRLYMDNDLIYDNTTNRLRVGQLMLGNQNVYGLGAVTNNFGTVQTIGTGKGSYEGYSIDGQWVFMSNGAGSSGIYNDTDNEWATKWNQNGSTDLYHNGVNKVQTTSDGAHVSGKLYADTAQIDSYVYHNGNTTTYFGFSANNQIVMRTNGADRITVKSDGDVGIGTGIPQGNLHISSGTSGDCVLILEADTDNNNEDDNPRIEFWQDGGIAESAIRQSDNYLDIMNSVTTLAGIRFFTGGATSGYTNAVERMHIDEAGRVGIGTNNPECMLQLSASTLSNNITDPIKLKIHNRKGASDWSTTQPWGLLEFDTNDTGGAGDGPVAGVGCRMESAGGGDVSLCFYTDSDGGNNTVLGAASERMCIDHDGNVGIGTTNPARQLEIRGQTTSSIPTIRLTNTAPGNDVQDLGGLEVYSVDGGGDFCGSIIVRRDNTGAHPDGNIIFRTGANGVSSDQMMIKNNGKVGINTASPTTQIHIKQGVDDSIAHGIKIERSFNSDAWNIYSGQYLDLVFKNNTNAYGYLQNAANVGQIDFTGQHRSFIDGMPFTKYDDFEGLIVSANKNKYYNIDKKLKTGLEAIHINESLPLVSISNVEKDKACFGVISGTEDPEARKYEQGMYVTVCQKQDGDTRAFINSVGEGAIWVTNINGSLESGDYITTSNVAGYGQKQDDDILHNYTVAKITMDCDFNPVTQPVEILKQEMREVNYWVQETHEDVSEEDYSNLTSENRTTKIETYYSNENGEISAETYNILEPHVQSTYTELTRTIYQKIIKEESKTEQEGYELEVRNEPVNVLDEHGQIQWEDHPTETEKAYKIRYLDADGNITDEANAVHIAAFVGCTYHCG